MNNSVISKQSENMIKCMDRRFTNHENEAKKLTGKVTFKDFHILSENIALWDMKKTNILLDKQIRIWFKIFEISKFKMFMNYERLKEVYKDNMHLFYTDTDSLELLIKNINPYILDETLLNYFDISNFKPSTISIKTWNEWKNSRLFKIWK